MGNEERHTQFWRIAAAVLTVALVIAVGWHQISMRRLQRDSSRERTAITEAFAQHLTVQAAELLLLNALPLALAVRPELLAKRFDHIDDFFSVYIRQKYVTRLSLVGVNDTVLVATDRKWEGQLGSLFLPDSLIAVAQPKVAQVDGDIQLAVPIMAFDERIGTLVVAYSGRSIADHVDVPITTQKMAAEAR